MREIYVPFDGMILGAPLLLALAPLLVFERDRLARWGPALSVALVYYVEWFYLVGQQVRFLLPAFPVFAAMVAAGVAAGAGVAVESLEQATAASNASINTADAYRKSIIPCIFLTITRTP